MRFVIAGGSVAGLASAVALARAGHSAVVLERDRVDPRTAPEEAFDAPRRGIPHFQQPHAFLPRGRQVLKRMAPDILETLVEAGAHEQDISRRLRGPRRPGDEDLILLWVRRPLIEWALRRAAAAEPAIELRPATTVTGLLVDEEPSRAAGVRVDGGERVEGDVVVDALGRYRTPPGWPRPAAEATDCGAIYYCRYFRLTDGADYPEGPWLLNPRGDLGYMGFNTFRGDNRTLAVILLVPAADRDLRILRDERAWMEACRSIRTLDAMTAPEAAVPITPVMPMGGLSNVMRARHPGLGGLVAVGDALCHTDPSFAFGLSFSLVHAEALAAAAERAGPDRLADEFLEAVGAEAAERHRLVCETDAARVRAWAGEPLDATRRHGCYPLFATAAAIAAAPHDDDVLRRTVGRIGLLERTAVFDRDAEVHARIERIMAELSAQPPAPAGPPRDELLDRVAEAAEPSAAAGRQGARPSAATG